MRSSAAASVVVGAGEDAKVSVISLSVQGDAESSVVFSFRVRASRVGGERVCSPGA